VNLDYIKQSIKQTPFFECEDGLLYCADCMDILPQLPEGCVDLVLTDIPYGQVNRESNGLRIFDKGDADICNIELPFVIHNSSRVASGSIYIFCGTEQVSELRAGFVDNGMSTRHCVWEKTNPPVANGQHLWLSSIENCVFAKHPRAVFNEHCESCVWRYPCGQSKVHPTEKPLSLIGRLILASSLSDDIVLDFCLGSGTTAVACKRLGRKWVGVEISEKYCKDAVSRIQAESKGISVKELKQGQKVLF
jgi:site-specific DNA-methyltransferase (adenine-specific)